MSRMKRIGFLLVDLIEVKCFEKTKIMSNFEFEK